MTRIGADVVRAYQRLYGIYQDITENPHLYELLLAFGLLTCRSGSKEVKRHLIAVRASVGFDSETGRLTVVAAPDGRRPLLEEDMLDERDRIADPARKEVLDLLDADAESLWGSDSIIEGALRRWVNGVSADGRYLADIARHQARTDRIMVSYAPALVLRERNRQSFVAAYQQIEHAIEESGEVPAAFRELVEIGDSRLDAPPIEGEQTATAEEEIYFPEPANEEQYGVVRRLRHQRAALVQWPPGTGKTHTIANLVTHLLAEGQRVLVTSHTTRALRVLRDKLPPEVQDLCVRLTDDRPSARDDLEQSETLAELSKVSGKGWRSRVSSHSIYLTPWKPWPLARATRQRHRTKLCRTRNLSPGLRRTRLGAWRRPPRQSCALRPRSLQRPLRFQRGGQKDLGGSANRRSWDETGPPPRRSRRRCDCRRAPTSV